MAHTVSQWEYKARVCVMIIRRRIRYCCIVWQRALIVAGAAVVWSRIVRSACSDTFYVRGQIPLWMDYLYLHTGDKVVQLQAKKNKNGRARVNSVGSERVGYPFYINAFRIGVVSIPGGIWWANRDPDSSYVLVKWLGIERKPDFVKFDS